MSLPRVLYRFAIVAASAVFATVPAAAQEAGGTLAKIKRTGTITLGVRDGSIPFSYLDDKQQYQGYSVDLCLKAVTGFITTFTPDMPRCFSIAATAFRHRSTE